MVARKPNKWLVILLIGAILGPLSGLVMFFGFFSDSSSLRPWSIVFTAMGWSAGILFWTGLIGFLVTKFRRLEEKVQNLEERE